MPIVYALVAALGLGYVAYRRGWATTSRTRFVPGAKVGLACPTSDEIDRFAHDKNVVIDIVGRASDVPTALSSDLDPDLFAYYVRESCDFYIGKNNTRVLGKEDAVLDEFYTWKYGPGWLESVRAGRVPQAIR